MRVSDRGAGITVERRSTVITRNGLVKDCGRKNPGVRVWVITVLAVSRLSNSSGFTLEGGVSPRMVIG